MRKFVGSGFCLQSSPCWRRGSGVKVDLTELEGLRETVRLNISMARRTLEPIDEAARLAGTTRSGFLAMAALEHINRRQQAS